MQLDYQTLYIVAAASLAAIAGIVVLAARSYSGDLSRAGYLWAAAVGLTALGYVFVAVRGLVPDTLSILGGHLTGVAGTCGFYHACRRLTRRPAHLLLIYTPALLATGSAAYFSLVVPNLAIRVAIFSALAALPLGLCAATLAPRRGAPASLTSNVGVIGFALGAGVLILRALLFMARNPATPQGVYPAYFASSSLEQLAILLTFVVFSALSLLFLVLCNDRLNQELERLATLDPLTERFNRRTIETFGRREVATARRRRSSIAVALIDLDEFKQINDRHGHAAGDVVLRSAVALLEQNLRAGDILGRYGGDELLIVMPETDVEHAAAVCERLRDLLARSRFLGAAAPVALTVSIGVAGAHGEGADFEQLVQAADAALYQAKRRGRNCTCVAEEPPTTGQALSRIV